MSTQDVLVAVPQVQPVSPQVVEQKVDDVKLCIFESLVPKLKVNMKSFSTHDPSSLVSKESDYVILTESSQIILVKKVLSNISRSSLVKFFLEMLTCSNGKLCKVFLVLDTSDGGSFDDLRDVLASGNISVMVKDSSLDLSLTTAVIQCLHEFSR